MDWRHNQWVGIGAAILVVFGIVGVFFYLSRPSTMLEHGGQTFVCEVSGETFNIPDSQFEKESVYMNYFNKVDEAVECKIDGNMDAYYSYYCPKCEKWFRYTRPQLIMDVLACPDGHEIPEENR